MALDIQISQKANYIYSVTLNGSLDTETYQKFEEALRDISDEKTKAIVLDMTGLNYISSIGIKSILVAQGALKKLEANFSMVNLQPQVKKVLDAMRILPMLDIFEGMPEAEKYFDAIINEEINK